VKRRFLGIAMIAAMIALTIPVTTWGFCEEQQGIFCGSECYDAGSEYWCSFGFVPPTYGCFLVDNGNGCIQGNFSQCQSCGGGF